VVIAKAKGFSDDRNHCCLPLQLEKIGVKEDERDVSTMLCRKARLDERRMVQPATAKRIFFDRLVMKVA
jgi:hypothetical protein